MTDRVQAILNTFERMSESEKKELSTEILRRSTRLDWSPLTDEELVQLAEERFLELDEAEAI